MKYKQAKPEVIRARCSGDLKRGVLSVAAMQQLDEADIIRIACAAYVQRFQQQMQLQNG